MEIRNMTKKNPPELVTLLVRDGKSLTVWKRCPWTTRILTIDKQVLWVWDTWQN